MTVVSKFCFAHILKLILWLGFAWTITFVIFYFEEFHTWNTPLWTNLHYKSPTTDSILLMLLIDVALAAFFYILVWEHDKITINEESVTLMDLITRRKRQIKYDEIKMVGTHQWYKTIRRKNGNTIYINSDVYSNIDDINLALLVNLDKYIYQGQESREI